MESIILIVALIIVVAIADFSVIKGRQNKAEKRKQAARKLAEENRITGVASRPKAEEEGRRAEIERLKRKWDEEKNRETAEIGTQNELINQSKNKKVISANNLIQKLKFSEDTKKEILQCMGTKETTLLVVCELVNKYFKEAKYNNLTNPSFGSELIFEIMFASANSQDSYDQAALYCSLYPEPFSRLSKDIEEYFGVAGITEAIEQIKKRSKETDGPYEDMLRRQGLTNPF